MKVLTMEIKIRPAAEADKVQWQHLWQGFCDFYKAPVSQEQTALTWSRILDPTHPIGCFVAESSEQARLVGFSTYFSHPSTWNATDDLYLEDLYVDGSVRGGGIGEKLIFNLRAYGKAKGYARLYWHTNDDNHRARGLYDKLTGGTDGYVRYRESLK